MEQLNHCIKLTVLVCKWPRIGTYTIYSGAFSLTITLGFYYENSGEMENKDISRTFCETKCGGLIPHFMKPIGVCFFWMYGIYERNTLTREIFSSFENERYDYRSTSIINEITCVWWLNQYMSKAMQSNAISSNSQWK